MIKRFILFCHATVIVQAQLTELFPNTMCVYNKDTIEEYCTKGDYTSLHRYNRLMFENTMSTLHVIKSCSEVTTNIKNKVLLYPFKCLVQNPDMFSVRSPSTVRKNGVIFYGGQTTNLTFNFDRIQNKDQPFPIYWINQYDGLKFTSYHNSPIHIRVSKDICSGSGSVNGTVIEEYCASERLLIVNRVNITNDLVNLPIVHLSDNIENNCILYNRSLQFSSPVVAVIDFGCVYKLDDQYFQEASNISAVLFSNFNYVVEIPFISDIDFNSSISQFPPILSIHPQDSLYLLQNNFITIKKSIMNIRPPVKSRNIPSKRPTMFTRKPISIPTTKKPTTTPTKKNTRKNKGWLNSL